MQNIYDERFLERLKSLKIKRSAIIDILKKKDFLSQSTLKVLANNLEHPKSKIISKTDPIDFTFFLENLIYSKSSLEERIEFAESIDYPITLAFEILFWVSPEKFPFPKKEVKNLSEFKTILKEQKELLKKTGLTNFLELYALQSVEKESFFEDIKSNLINVNKMNLEENLWIVDFWRKLSPVQKKEVEKLLDKYVLYVLENLSKGRKGIPVVIDGNNVFLSTELKYTKEDKIDVVLNYLTRLKELYFPYYIVFDNNAPYIFDTGYFDHKNTYFHSPADELLIEIAKERNGVIFSKDKFRNYAENIKTLWFGG